MAWNSASLLICCVPLPCGFAEGFEWGARLSQIGISSFFVSGPDLTHLFPVAVCEATLGQPKAI